MIIKKNIFTLALLLSTGAHAQNDEIAQTVNLEAVKQLTEQQQTIITNIITQVVDSTLDFIADAIEDAQTHTISLEQAQTLLQNQIDACKPGYSFALNDVNYTIAA
jgi:hypothetical protein